MAQLVKVLRSADRRWRVEFWDNNRCRVYERGFLAAMVWRYELNDRLAALGVDAEQLVED